MKTEELAINGGRPVFDHVVGYGHQLIEQDDFDALAEVLMSGYLTCGPTTVAFEDALKEVTGAYAVTAVANGTAALHVACLAAGIKPGDEVIVSPITFAASANCVRYCGGTPVFADICPDTWNIDPVSIRQKVTDRTKAVVAVDFGGCHVNSDEIRKICDEFDLTFIEDAAHSIGTTHKDKPVGSIADITCFSFHPVKTVTTGEGGAVATTKPELAKKIELFAKHGITRDVDLLRDKDQGGWYYEQLVLGYNYRISDIEAALGVSQLRKLDRFAVRRKEIVAYYNEQFATVPEVSFQYDENPAETVRHLYCLEFDTEALGVTRRFLFDALRAEGIGTNVHYQPVYWLPYYQDLGYEKGECPNAEHYYEHVITMPLHCCLSDEETAGVVKAVKKVIGWCRESKGAGA